MGYGGIFRIMSFPFKPLYFIFLYSATRSCIFSLRLDSDKFIILQVCHCCYSQLEHAGLLGYCVTVSEAIIVRISVLDMEQNYMHPIYVVSVTCFFFHFFFNLHFLWYFVLYFGAGNKNRWEWPDRIPRRRHNRYGWRTGCCKDEIDVLNYFLN